MVGAPDVVVKAAFAGIAMAAKVIDMSKQSGAHPRMGATDVCPFVPVQGVTMEECAALARELGARVANELDIPVYLYEHAATDEGRENLAKVRSGEYEGLAAKLVDPVWAPDFGAAAYTNTVERSGATIIGARPFLIAYNVNLNTKNVKKAMKIAALVREKGIIVRDASGEIVRDAEEKAVRKPGLFKCVKAIGWYIEEYDRCQVSINFTNYKTSSLHEVVDAIRRVADQEGVVVTGSELVGLVPLDAMTAAGQYYLERQGVNPGATERELVEVAIRSLGLRDLGPFDPEQAIVERRLGGDGRLVAMTGRTFIDTLSSIAPAPGGGSVAALCGAMGTALAAMVGQLSTGKKGYAERDADWRDMAVRAQALKEAFLADVDADTAAFDGIMAGFGMPKSNREEKIARRNAIQSATQVAIEVPLRVLERSVEAVGLLCVAAEGNENARSDAGVGALVVRAAAEGAWYNVTINLKGFKDETLSASFRSRADVALAKVTDACDEITAEIRRHLG
jgi:glutamate formiminotransferase/formiminotetrahydrofolate cyclodeaminase